MVNLAKVYPQVQIGANWYHAVVTRWLYCMCLIYSGYYYWLSVTIIILYEMTCIVNFSSIQIVTCDVLAHVQLCAHAVIELLTRCLVSLLAV